MVPEAFRSALVEAVEKQFGTQKELAAELDIDTGYLSQLIHGHGDSPGPMTCIKFALITGRSPADVLRLAEKHAEALLLDQAYGSFVKSRLTHTQRRWLVILEYLPARARTGLLVLFEVLISHCRFKPSNPLRRRIVRRHPKPT